jgi:hypothetical protein
MSGLMVHILEDGVDTLFNPLLVYAAVDIRCCQAVRVSTGVW